jgi:hypothetical protein
MSEVDEYLDTAIILIKKGDIDKARFLLRDLVERYPDDRKVQDEVPTILEYARRRSKETDENEKE